MFVCVETIRGGVKSAVIVNTDAISRIEHGSDVDGAAGAVFMTVPDGYAWLPLTLRGLNDICEAVSVDYPYRWETEDLPDGFNVEDACRELA